jgi:octaprenyl-diphosphate synthase
MAPPEPPTLDTLQELVSDGLDDVVDELRRIVVSDFAMVEEVNRYLLMVRGKLFRPMLTLLANQVGGAPDDRAKTLAAVVELVHLATLVHDDAVDHSVLRRGQPTVNAMWTHQVAIIMGDYLYSRAVIELADLEMLEAVRIMGNAANEMSVGEMRQLTSHDALDFSEDDYERLIAAKTASLMKAACEMGALVGVPAFREPLGRFGHALGMAFQVADDLLDFTGTEEETGKPTGHDLRERKVTLPLVGALPHCSPEEMDEIRAFFSGDEEPADEAIARIIEITGMRGGIEYARTRAQSYADDAEAALQELTPGPAVNALRACVGYATRRRR